MPKILKIRNFKINELDEFILKFRIDTTATGIIARLDSALSDSDVLPVSTSGFIEIITWLGKPDVVYYEVKTERFVPNYRFTFIKIYPCVYGFKYDHDSELVYSEIIKEA